VERLLLATQGIEPLNQRLWIDGPGYIRFCCSRLVSAASRSRCRVALRSRRYRSWALAL